jgi:transcriptional regulator with XRE-family HTH domain
MAAHGMNQWSKDGRPRRDDTGPLGCGERLYRLRRGRGFNRPQAAALLRVKKDTIAQWEDGRFYPSFWNLLQLVEVYGVDLDYIMYGPTYEETNTAHQRTVLQRNVQETLRILDAPVRVRSSTDLQGVWREKVPG